MPPVPGQPPAWAPLVVGGVAMIVFVQRQLKLQRTNSALLDLRVFASRNFTISLLMFAILMLGLFGTIILLPIYLQNVLQHQHAADGPVAATGRTGDGPARPKAGGWYDRIGPAKLVIPGVVIVTAVLWAMTLLGTQSRVENILAGHIVMSIGFGLLFTPLFTVSLSSVRPELYSHGSAVLGSLQQVAGAAGVALFVALMSAQTARRRGRGRRAHRSAGRRHSRGVSLRRDHRVVRSSLRLLRAQARRAGDAGRALSRASATPSLR